MGEQLNRLQRAWDRAAAPQRARWEAAKADVLAGNGPTPMDEPSLLANGTYAYDSGRYYPESTYDLPGLVEQDDVFLEICDHPNLVGLLSVSAAAPFASSFCLKRLHRPSSAPAASQRSTTVRTAVRTTA